MAMHIEPIIRLAQTASIMVRAFVALDECTRAPCGRGGPRRIRNLAHYEAFRGSGNPSRCRT